MLAHTLTLDSVAGLKHVHRPHVLTCVHVCTHVSAHIEARSRPCSHPKEVKITANPAKTGNTLSVFSRYFQAVSPFIYPLSMCCHSWSLTHKVLPEICLQKKLILTFLLVQISGSTSLGSALGSHFGKLLLFACYYKLIPNVCILFMNIKFKQAFSPYLCVYTVSTSS